MISAMGSVGATRLCCQVASVKHFGPSLTRRNELESADDDQSVRNPQKVLAVHQGALCVCIFFFYLSDGYSLSSYPKGRLPGDVPTSPYYHWHTHTPNPPAVAGAVVLVPSPTRAIS